MSKASEVLNKIEEKASVTLAELMEGAKKVQPGIESKADSVKIDLKDVYTWKGTNSKLFSGDTLKEYKPKIRFYGIKEDDVPNARKTKVRVDCNCKSYYHYFSYPNWKAGAHEGKKDTTYVPVEPEKRKRAPGPPKNPEETPGMCKHLLKFAESLIDSGYVED